jgi:hypothetical protein
MISNFHKNLIMLMHSTLRSVRKIFLQRYCEGICLLNTLYRRHLKQSPIFGTDRVNVSALLLHTRMRDTKLKDRFIKPEEFNINEYYRIQHIYVFSRVRVVLVTK